MRAIFEEYGKGIIALIVLAALIGILFTGVKILDVTGEQANVTSELSHSKSEEALNVVSNRVKPEISVSNSDNLYISKNKAFQPAKIVECIDADNNAIVPDIVSILFVDADGNQTEFIDNYNKEKDWVVLNTEHYTESHTSCYGLEFSGDDETINNPDNYNMPGTVVVTYKATDSYNVFAVKKLSFVIDSK